MHVRMISYSRMAVAIVIWLVCCKAYSQNVSEWEDYYTKAEDSYNQGNYNESHSLYKQALELAEKEYTDQDWQLAYSAGGVGLTYWFQENYEKAIFHLSMQLDFLRLQQDKESLVPALSNLGTLYYEIENYELSEKLIDEALDLIEALPDMDFGEWYLSNLTSKMIILDHFGNFDEKLHYAQVAYEYAQQNLNPYDFGYLRAKGDLMECYVDQEYYKEALQLSHELIKQYEEKSTFEPEDYINYSQYLRFTARTYSHLGQYKKASEILEKALAYETQLIKADPIWFQHILGDVGVVQAEMGNLAKSLEILFKALEVSSNDEKISSSNYSLWGNIALNYSEMGKIEEAIRYADKLLTFLNEGNFPPGEDIGMAYNNLAIIYGRARNPEKAIELLQKAISTTEENFGKDHSSYAHTLSNLGIEYLSIGNYKKAREILVRSHPFLISQIEKVFRYGSEKDKKDFLQTLFFKFEYLKTLNLTIRDDHLTSLNLSNELIFKGLLLNSSKGVYRQLLTLDNEEITEDVAKLDSLKKKLYSSYSRTEEGSASRPEALKAEISSLESSLHSTYADYQNKRNFFEKNWRDVQKKLNEDEIVIEFSHFTPRYNKKGSDSLVYHAYLYNRASEIPLNIYLFEEKDLQNLLQNSSPNNLYSSRGSKAESNRQINSDSLYQVIWQPIEEVLSKYSKVYYSPSGVLNQISFAALKDQNNELLSQKYDLVQLSNSSILEEGLIEPHPQDFLLIGGIDYNKTSEKELKPVIPDFNILQSMEQERSNGGKSSWAYLPGTKKEIQSLASLLETKNVDSWSGTEATEEKFKSLSGQSPEVLHIATHGFFYENAKIEEENSMNNINISASNPLLRSGLLLAGANMRWTGQATNNSEDGILTALEISNMDLSNTDLVILSACETGLGDINGSEGVYGLQRAFKMAGVDILIMSLWEVPDKETAEFMNLFYKNWIDGGKVRLAFQQTQRTMSERYKDSPEKWAAFVMFE